jgi:asparagine synthase (glutamine-hydrolysing)
LRSSAGPTVYFSFAEDALTLGVLRFTPNWEYLGAYLTLHQVFSRITALDGVRMLIPGECHSHRYGQFDTCLHWNPCDIATDGIITDRVEAVSTLRSTVLTCAAALVSEHPRIVHLLSGGVDSSIILAAIRRAAAASAVVCLNLYYENSAADERKFARLAAARAGCELIELSMNEGIRLEDSLRLARTVNPVWAFQCVANSENYAQIAQRVGASAMSSALCGDSLFMSGPTTPAAAEFLKQRGLHPQLLRTVQIVSALDGVSAVRVLRGAIRDAWFKNFDSTWRPHKEVNRQSEERVVDWSLIATVLDDPKFNNPWINAAREVPVGKRWQIFYLPFDDFYYDPATTTRYPERIDVTASQPVAEICLRIPAYVHVQNGWNRGVARDAFAQELPKEIYTRATKGNPMQWAARQTRENVGFIRELLLDGELVRHGLLNRVKLEEALSQSFRKNSYSITRLFDVINAETWLQIWRGAEHRAAA